MIDLEELKRTPEYKREIAENEAWRNKDISKILKHFSVTLFAKNEIQICNKRDFDFFYSDNDKSINMQCNFEVGSKKYEELKAKLIKIAKVYFEII